MTEFTARAASVFRDDVSGSEILVLAEHEDGSGRRLELQKGEAATSADERLGMASYCLVTETGATHYGGIDTWSMRGIDVAITLTSKAAAVLGADGGYLIHVVGADSDPRDIERGLAVITGDLAQA